MDSHLGSRGAPGHQRITRRGRDTSRTHGAPGRADGRLARSDRRARQGQLGTALAWYKSAVQEKARATNAGFGRESGRVFEAPKPMREQQNPSTPELHQPLLFAPSELLACGLRDAHHHPLVGVRTEDGVRSWRTLPATAWTRAPRRGVATAATRGTRPCQLRQATTTRGFGRAAFSRCRAVCFQIDRPAISGPRSSAQRKKIG